ncbi:MAG: hypothetical protein KJ904_17630 [Alphaproteobacteria bacterium]|nr:hypothetical protein [Alphaproteobacteria bacterium]MBU0797233.1 hypothetical protein [Alphaproteobacteria bacterium]MBU0888979.1 hypothetical protein [Alphaproteobacteria bacterium]MBU1813999.1 hypothetical protein [Alphaproteobacteria bacterium]
MMLEVNLLRDAGEAIGNILAWIASGVLGIVASLGNVFDDFFGGVADGVGMSDATLFSWVLLALGVFFLIGAVQSFIRASIIGGIFQLVIGAFLIGWAIS